MWNRNFGNMPVRAKSVTRAKALLHFAWTSYCEPRSRIKTSSSLVCLGFRQASSFWTEISTNLVIIRSCSLRFQMMSWYRKRCFLLFTWVSYLRIPTKCHYSLVLVPKTLTKARCCHYNSSIFQRGKHANAQRIYAYIRWPPSRIFLIREIRVYTRITYFAKYALNHVVKEKRRTEKQIRSEILHTK